MEFRNIVSERIVSLQMEIDSLKNEVADLKKMVTMPQEKPTLQEEPKPWKPECVEKYFYISQTGRVIQDTFTEHRIDIARKNFGNFFSTSVRAEQVAKKIRLLLQLEQLHDQLCPDFEHDYENYYDAKYTIAFNHIERRMKPEIVFDCCESFPVCFESIGAVQKAADILNAELEEAK